MKHSKYDGRSEIFLNDHQIEPTYRLITNDIHGLVLYYNMGTGKTISGLTLILNYPELKINILCPENLIFLWTNELNRLPIIENKIKFYSYENINKFFNRDTFSNEIIIIDEAHNIIPYIKYSKNIYQKISLLNSSHKILLLTGTPIYNGLTDLIYLINISAGRQILSYNDTEFIDKYYYINRSRSYMFGYFLPILDKMLGISRSIIGLTIYIPVFSIFTNNKTILKFIDLCNIIQKYGIKPLLPGNINTDIFDSYGNPVFNKLTKESVIKYVSLEFLTNYLSRPFVFIGVLSAIVWFIYFIRTILNIKYKIEDYKILDSKKLINDINSYIIIHKKNYNIKKSPFPIFKIYSKEVSYSDFQLVEWLKLTQGRFNKEIIKNLNITDINDVNYYIDKLDLKTYIEKGIIIGNLKDNLDYSPKFYKVLKIAEGKRAVIYSSFTDNGILLFKEFLEKKSVKYLYLDSNISDNKKNNILNKFKQSNIILLIHPKYTEGLNIIGAEQLHILEPIPVLAKKNQVIARVIRYKSHNHLPLKERNVDIYQWYCTINSIFDKLRTTLFMYKTWLEFNPEVFLTEKFNKFDIDISPDSIIIQEETLNNERINEIDSELMKYDKTHIDCCIKFPTEAQQNNCKKRRCSIKNRKTRRSRTIS